MGLFWGIDTRGVIGESGEEPKKTGIRLGLEMWRVGDSDLNLKQPLDAIQYLSVQYCR